jgi:hypothetical protein
MSYAVDLPWFFRLSPMSQQAPSVRILKLTGIIPSQATMTIFQGAADGYILKDASPPELLDALRCVATRHAAPRPTAERSRLARRGARRPLWHDDVTAVVAMVNRMTEATGVVGSRAGGDHPPGHGGESITCRKRSCLRTWARPRGGG